MLRNVKVIADVIYKDFYWVFICFFADTLVRQTEKFWIYLEILLPTYLAPEFRRLCKNMYILKVYSMHYSLR